MASDDILMTGLAGTLADRGYVHLPAPALQRIAGWMPADWAPFASSWDGLGEDRYMADGGRYRRRRHAAFEASGGTLVRKPHQPHFQSRDYNPLNGDVQRWFAEVEADIARGPVLGAIFAALTSLFAGLDGREAAAPWHSEVHQFRIEASPAEPGRPTPEGLHRDGVDWVLVMLIARRNVEEGTTEIGGEDGQPLGRFMLCDPGDAVLLDDRRIRHGVTPIRVAQGTGPAYRDALVVTWKS